MVLIRIIKIIRVPRIVRIIRIIILVRLFIRLDIRLCIRLRLRLAKIIWYQNGGYLGLFYLFSSDIYLFFQKPRVQVAPAAAGCS